MRVLITGAAGYLGQRLVASLATRPDVVVRALVHRSAPVFPAGVEVVRGAVDERSALRGTCDGVTHVVHLAGLAQAACERDPREALSVSGAGTLNVVREAAGAGVRRVVYVSTYHVYGAADDRAMLHEDAPLRPLNMYGVSRVAGEACARLAGASGGMETLVLRLANGFGAPSEPGMEAWRLVVNDLCWRAVHDGEMVLRASGVQQRDFIPLSDSVDAVEYFLSVGSAELTGDTFNVGSGSVRRLLDVAADVRQEYERLFGRSVPLRTGVDRESEPPIRPMDITRALSAGFTPARDVTGEIRRTLAAAAAATSAARSGEVAQ